MMKRSRTLALLVVAGSLAAACSNRDEDAVPVETAAPVTAAPAAPVESAAPDSAAPVTEPAPTEAPTTTEAPAAGEIGVNADTIKVAAIGDVDTPLGPLSGPIIAAVQGWAKNVNADGGLAGRQVEVTFYDSKLNPDEAANAYIQACQDDFAGVGTAPFVLLNPAPIVECKDSAGAVTGFPDFGSLAISPGSSQSASTYALIVAGTDFKGDPTMRYTPTYGYKYVKEQLGGVTPKILVLEPGVPGTHAGGEAQADAAVRQGWESAGVVTFADQAPQAEATPIVNTIKSEGVNVVWSTSVGVAKVMAEAKVQGIDTSKIVWLCTTQCSSPAFIEQNADSIEGLYVFSVTKSWNETDDPQIAAYLASVDPADVSVNGVAAYASALAFQELVESIVAEKGVNGITRAALIEKLEAATPVSAGGLLHPSTILGKTNPCSIISQVQGGKLVRADPLELSEFNCDPESVTYHPDTFK
jgi:ABC-type branched-subunit amino acid transport system substrate-binding protein